MRKILLSVFVVCCCPVLLFAQVKDCWVFVAPSVSKMEVTNFWGPQVQGYSEWFNAFAVQEIQQDWNKYAAPFEIDSLRCYSSDVIVTSSVAAGLLSDSLPSDSTTWVSEYAQISILQGELFTQRGWTGKGITIGVLDAGFLGLKEDSTLQHLIKNNQIKDTWDFVRKNNDVYRASKHGTQVLSCMAGLDHHNQFGLATDANFLLARAEQNYSAYLIRESRWIEALEWAVKHGAQIVTSSLIFSDQLFKRAEMNGKSLLSQAAERAWEKGVLVLNSAGNSGEGYWEIIGAPGDAEHVLTVGACGYNGLKSDFSSIGPTADYRMKPNVVALGDVFVSAGNEVEMVSGTSFACPMVAGFAACVLEGHPDKRPSDLWSEIQQSATLYPYYDYSHGYGVPQASYFIQSDKLESDSVIGDQSIEIKFNRISQNLVEIEVHDNEFPDHQLDSSVVSYTQVDTLAIDAVTTGTDSLYFQQPSENAVWLENPNLMYVHIENEKGQLEEYWVVQPEGSSGGMYDVFKYSGHFLRVYYRQRIVTYLIE